MIQNDVNENDLTVTRRYSAILQRIRIRRDIQLFKCECCRQESKPVFAIDYVRMIYHLYEMHNKSEIMKDPKYESVAISFNFIANIKTDVGKCLVSNCGVTIKSKFDKTITI